jgi:hypothetical protein
MNARKIVDEVIAGLNISTSTQEVEITGWLQIDLIRMQKAMLKANPCIAFEVIELPQQTFLLIYVDRKATFMSNVVEVDFVNKSIVSYGRADRRG